MSVPKSAGFVSPFLFATPVAFISALLHLFRKAVAPMERGFLPCPGFPGPVEALGRCRFFFSQSALLLLLALFQRNLALLPSKKYEKGETNALHIYSPNSACYRTPLLRQISHDSMVVLRHLCCIAFFCCCVHCNFSW